MHTLEKHSTPNDRLLAGFLIVIIAGIFVAISHHPVVSDGSLASEVAEIRRLGGLDQIVHGSIMAVLIPLTAIMAIFSDRLGRQKLAVLAALTAYISGTVLMIIAMGFDGFVFPALADRCDGTTASCAESLNSAFILSSAVIQSFTRLGFFATALAFFLWSVHLCAVERKWFSGILGLLSAVAQVVALTTASVHLTPHTLMFVLAGWAVWFGVVSVWFWNTGSATAEAG